MRVVKTFFKKHIDLDHVVAISDAYMTYVPWGLGHHPAVGFSIEFALRDAPMTHTRLVAQDEFKDKKFVMEDGTLVDNIPYDDDRIRTMAEANLQSQIDELIYDWKHKV